MALSIKATLNPLLAKDMAQALPAGPPPIIATSKLLFSTIKIKFT